MKLGRFVTDEAMPGGIGVYVGRCNSCNDKVIINRSDAAVIASMHLKESNSLWAKTVKYLHRRRSN